MSNVVGFPLEQARENDLFAFFQERFDTHYEQHEIDVNEYEKTVQEMEKRMNSEGPKMFDVLVEEYGEVITTTVITSFQLGKFFHNGDQIGGDVSTIHNASQGIYSREKDKYNRSDYDYSKAREFVQKQNLQENGYYKDGYTGKRTKDPNVDHIIPLNVFHKKGAFMLTQEAKKKLSSDQRNLIVTDESLNKSKSDQELGEFMNKTVKGQKENNHSRFEMDKRRTNAAANKANRAYDDHLPSNLERAQYYVKNGTVAASKEAFRVGVRQAWGMIMYVFSKEMFAELKIHGKQFKQYAKEGRLISEFKELLVRVTKKVSSQLKGIVTAFKDGAVSGFLSNIMTTIMNCFKTTSKRLVKIIREGFLSIFRAIKLLVFTPKELTKQEACREAIKLLVSGLFVAGGIVIEEVLEKKLMALGIPGSIANAISSTLTGIITGIGIVTVVYMLDKLISNLPSTKELIEKSNELIQNQIVLEASYEMVTANIQYGVEDDFLSRIRKTEKNINDLVDFFEE
ncbi:TPA: DUF1524 domain-containing protein [Bacillus cereus]|uniref:DUF1524 domain-containing protein n=1 Tax=Bacillus cereus TaxID=1396 RepID=UPI001F45C12C|nr:DUF1524 domain-containing protein [Bacillus cereus]BCC10480.1 hypothetical protein BCM0074_0863 [Bacillus cereus]HDR6305253.1 DUF1524 domain-containing protein [Bacillus cereus]